MASRELQHLLKVLKGHNIALGRDDVAWAFESGSTAGDVSAWVREYLSPHSLLTREELHLYISESLTLRLHLLTRDTATKSTRGPYGEANMIGPPDVP